MLTYWSTSMIRLWPCLMFLAIAQPVWAGEADAPYYGPMQRWHGIGYKFGYEDRTEKDGVWRIDAAVHGRGDAIDMALYRAAERARDEGYRYVFFLGGRGGRSPGIDQATIYAKPSHAAVPPIGCRSRKATGCYTADVAEVLRILGGPDGTQPGVAITDHRDEFGRAVFLSGYGTGGVASPIPGGLPRSHVTTIVENRSKSGSAVVPIVLTPRSDAAPRFTAASVPAPRSTAVAMPSRNAAAPTASDRFEQAVKENRPARGRDPKLGWTISD